MTKNETPLNTREPIWAAHAFGCGIKTVEGVERAQAAIDVRMRRVHQIGCLCEDCQTTMIAEARDPRDGR